MNQYWSNQPLNPYFSKSITRDGMRLMADSRGNAVPAVTTIQETMRSRQQQAALTTWRHRVGDFAANRAIQIGKQGHLHLKRYWYDPTISCPPLIQDHWKQLLTQIPYISNIRLVEGNLFHFYEGYGGRVDLVANFYDIPCAIEFKFCDRIKPIYEDISLQLAAYVGALNRQYGKPYQVEIKNAVIIMVSSDEVDVTWFNTQEINKYWQQWQHKVNQFWQQQQQAA